MKLNVAALAVVLATLPACQTDQSAQEELVTASTSGSGAMVTPFTYAEANCGECHAVALPWLSPNPMSPTFADIANRPGLTRESLASWLKEAHNYPEQMDFDLDDAHAEALADYMITLQDPDYIIPPS